MAIHIKYNTIPCGGNLRFSHFDGHRSIHICDKCGDEVNLISNYSYEHLEKHNMLPTQKRKKILKNLFYKFCINCPHRYEDVIHSINCQKCNKIRR